MSRGDIESVMVNGKIVIDKRKATTLDESEVMDKARAWQKKIQEK
jgi:hypothetical protein